VDYILNRDAIHNIQTVDFMLSWQTFPVSLVQICLAYLSCVIVVLIQRLYMVLFMKDFNKKESYSMRRFSIIIDHTSLKDPVYIIRCFYCDFEKRPRNYVIL